MDSSFVGYHEKVRESALVLTIVSVTPSWSLRLPACISENFWGKKVSNFKFFTQKSKTSLDCKRDSKKSNESSFQTYSHASLIQRETSVRSNYAK